MKPYGLINKILHNHPVNWWESETRDCIRKKSERQKAKKEILTFIED